MGGFLFSKYFKLFTGRISFARCKHTLTSPLDNIKVIDLTRILAGPYCTMILGDLGAEIFKIESLGIGDETRNWPPYVNGYKKEMSCYYSSVNRNKKSLCVNLKSQRGKEVIYDLSKVCDVLVENYVPGKLESMGLGYDKLSTISPHLIYCSITGYGSKGSYKNKPGVDVIAASMGGFLEITGPEGGEPCKAGVAVTDLATGLYAHGAILAALIQRGKTGRGQRLECDLLSTQIACLVNIGSNYLNMGKEGKRWGTAHESIVPYESFPTADGWMTIGAIGDSQFKSLCDILDLPELKKDNRFSTNALRVDNRDILIKTLKEKFISRTNKEWLASFKDATFVYGPVNKLSQVFADPHVREIGLVDEMRLKSGDVFKFVGPPVTYSDSLNAPRLPPPELGEHTRDVLSDLLNYNSAKIDSLLKNGDVK